MHADNVTTSFGRRPITFALLKGQMDARNHKPGCSVDKWKVFRDLCEAREVLGINDRALSVLNALLSFYPHSELSDEKNLIVFPSNAQLTLRAHGITGTTLRRHLAALIDCGLIHRKDSPNGKRYAHRDSKGAVDIAYGFSLRPILSRAAEFAHMAEQLVAERKALRLAKERLTICRRDIRKLISAAIEEGMTGDWSALSIQLDNILSHLSRKPDLAEISSVTRTCDLLRQQIINHLEMQLNSQITDSSDVQNERHLQNTNPDTNIEKDAACETMRKPPAAVSGGNRNSIIPPSLSFVLKACPQIIDYGPRGEITGARDLVLAATVVRMMLGINDATYADACNAMGAQNAACAVAYILERGGLIKSAGGYLRDLSRRAARGPLSIEGMLQSLLRARAPEGLQ